MKTPHMNQRTYIPQGRLFNRRNDAGTSLFTNKIGVPAALAQFGWLGQALTIMANTRRWAYALNEANQITIDQNFPLQLITDSPEGLAAQCRMAVQGVGTKQQTNGQYPAAGADLTLSLGSIQCFGVRLRISDSPTSFKYGSMPVELRNNATAVGRLWVQVNSLPCDIVILAISNTGGQGTVTPLDTPRVFLPGSANASYPASSVSSSTYAYAETLNARDLGTPETSGV